MEDFLNDLTANLKTYYNQIVDITPKLLLALVVVVIVWLIAVRVKMFADRRLKTRMHDALLATFIANLIKAVLVIIGILLMFRIVGLNGIAGSILAGAGISAFIIGFALKDIGENFLAGILLAFKRPFTIGDIIESNGVKGKVIALNLRDTQIKSDGKDIFIPNALLIKNTLTNYNSGGYLLQDININIEYGSDYQKAIDLIKGVLRKNEDAEKRGFKNNVVISGMVGAAAQINIRYWVKSDNIITDGHIRSETLINVLNVLHENGFAVKKE